MEFPDWVQFKNIYCNKLVTYVVDIIAAGFSVAIPHQYGTCSLVRRHDRSFVVHLLERAIKPMLV